MLRATLLALSGSLSRGPSRPFPLRAWGAGFAAFLHLGLRLRWHGRGAAPRRRGDRMSNSAGGEKAGIVSPTIRCPQVNGSSAPPSPQPGTASKKEGGGGSGRRSAALWRRAPARASLPRSRSACAGGAHEAAGGSSRDSAGSFADRWHSGPARPRDKHRSCRRPLRCVAIHSRERAFPRCFRRGLGKLGWEEGKNLILEARATEGRAERFAEHAAELVALKVDVTVGSNSQAVQALKDKTSTIPIVMLDVSHPVEAGFISFLARPGGNITGVTHQVNDSMPRHLSC